MKNLNSLIENLSGLCRRSLEEAAQFCRRRASVALDTLADETKPLQRNASQIDAFDANLQPMDGIGMGQDHLDDADVDCGEDCIRTVVVFVVEIKPRRGDMIIELYPRVFFKEKPRRGGII